MAAGPTLPAPAPMGSPDVLLLTDIVDSTRVSEALGDAAAAALWQQHDRIARALLGQWRGREIDKSDGLLLLFASVADAVGYAQAYHLGLLGLSPPLRARAAVHTGALWLRENPAEDVARGAKPLEVDGLAKAVTARLMAVAGGGQTLLSSAARQRLAPPLPALHSHGHWRLKGVAAPLEVHAVGPAAEQRPQASAKAWPVARRGDMWLPLHAVPHTLPAERDAFVGRAEVLADLARSFADGARVVSLVGPGGVGKTRLALRHGWQWLGDHPGGVWFCDLSAARSLDGIAHGVAQGLQLPLTGADPLAQIGHALAGRGDCLLILDNFEQLVRHAEASLGRWLDLAPQARLLVTSREVLALPGEQALGVPGLPQDAGVRLFHERARAATGCPLQADEAGAVPALVDTLDGLPLAIELAASRSRILSPQKMLDRIGERFRLFGQASGRNDRQATLRATLDWSWDLLDEAERETLAQLSVFEGGFTLELAEAVLDLSARADAPWPGDAVQSLVQKSLVRAQAGRRFDLLRTVQDYAAEHLTRRDGQAAAQARHWHALAALHALADIGGADAEADNLVAATRRATAAGDAAAACRALQGTWGVLRRSGPTQGVAELAQAVLALPALAGDAAAAHAVCSAALLTLGRADAALAQARAGQALAAPESATALRLHCTLAEALGSLGEVAAAQAELAAAEALADRLGDERLRCQVLNERGAWLMHRGRLREAGHCYADALALARRLGDRRWEGGQLGNLGAVAHMLGHADEASGHYQAALALATEAGDRRWAGNTHCNLGLLHQEAGHHDAAEAQFDAALATARHLGHRRLEATVQCNLGLLRDAQQRPADAAQYFQAAATLAERAGDRRGQGQSLGYLGGALARLGQAGAAGAAFAAADELLDQVGDPMSLGLLHCARAEAAQQAGDAASVSAALARARQALSDSGAGADSELARRIAALAGAVLSRPG